MDDCDTAQDRNASPALLQHERERIGTMAIQALAKCDQHIAVQICASVLANWETGGPVMGDLLGTVHGDALLWADCAPPHELVAYGTAALDRLRHLQLGIEVRKRLLVQLWESLDHYDRQQFLRRVDQSGKFRRKETV